MFHFMKLYVRWLPGQQWEVYEAHKEFMTVCMTAESRQEDQYNIKSYCNINNEEQTFNSSSLEWV